MFLKPRPMPRPRSLNPFPISRPPSLICCFGEEPDFLAMPFPGIAGAVFSTVSGAVSGPAGLFSAPAGPNPLNRNNSERVTKVLMISLAGFIGDIIPRPSFRCNPLGASKLDQRPAMGYNPAMNPRFHCQLVNGPGGDPVVYIEFKFERRAILFDLGELGPLPPRKLLKVSHVFVSHTHMDHFIGFDTLLRVSLGREKKLYFYGPPGFIGQVEAKLRGYSWNLVENYAQGLEIRAVEVHPDHLQEVCFPVREAFRPRRESGKGRPFDGRLLEEESFLVKAAFLDHKIPCLAFSLEEQRHLNILRTGLEALQLPKGLWLKFLKEAVWRGEGEAWPVRIWSRDPNRFQERTLPLGFLKEHLVKMTPGQKIVFAVDTVLNDDTEKTLVDLARDADLFFVEAAFLDIDRERAEDKYHLTAGQAGRLARQAGVKRLLPIHFSPKYAGDPSVLEQEALAAFTGQS